MLVSREDNISDGLIKFMQLRFNPVRRKKMLLKKSNGSRTIIIRLYDLDTVVEGLDNLLLNANINMKNKHSKKWKQYKKELECMKLKKMTKDTRYMEKEN